MRGGATPLFRALPIATCFHLLTCMMAVAEPLTLDITEAKAATDQRTNEPVVSIVFTEQSARTFTDFTAKNIGKAFEIRVDGRVVVKSVIREPILSGSARIMGRFSPRDVEEMIGRLSSGGGKLEFEVVSSD